MTIHIDWALDNRLGILKYHENPIDSDKNIVSLASKCLDVIVTIADYDYSISWKIGSEITLRHYRCALSDYPEPSDWELQHFNEFLLYEINHDRRIGLWCDNIRTEKAIINSIEQFFQYEGKGLSEFVNSKLAVQYERARNIPPELTHCQGCLEKSCITDLICHVTSIADAEKILKSGEILSACRVRNKSGYELAREERNAAGDPPDYFEYVMFTFANCTAGDRLVMERNLKRLPTQQELTSKFDPGVRFYVRYSDLVGHPRFSSDGYHHCKIKDMLELGPYLVTVTIPETSRDFLSKATPPDLKEYLSFVDDASYSNLWSWSHQSYKIARQFV